MASNGPPQRIRVCHIAATTEGAIWVFEQLRDLRDRFGYDVTVIVNGKTGALVDHFNRAGIRVLDSDFEFLGTADLFALPKKILALRALLLRERFDIVQTHLFHSMVIGRLAAYLSDVPVRLAMIAGPFHLEAHTPRWIDGSTQWMETALIPSCEFSRTLYRAMGVPEQRLHVIYYGPDETKFDPAKHAAANLRDEYGWPPETKLIAMVAYFYSELGYNRWTPPAVQGRPVKCQADMIAAMPIILKSVPDAKLLLVGCGWEDGGHKYMAKMQALVAELGITDSVCFTGYRTDIPAVLKSVDVAVQASLSENLGGSIEGLLMQRPMVATRVGGLVDSVIDGETGVLVAPGDPADLARGVLRLLQSPDEARAMAERGRALMLRKFTLRQTVEDQDELYRTLFARAPAGYRITMRVFRLLPTALVSLYLLIRYRFVDTILLPMMDSGWRPWHFIRLRRLARRIAGAAQRRAVTWKNLRGAPLWERITQAARSGRPIPTALPPLPSPIPVGARMALYRFYAFIGRQKLGWGLRAKAKRAILSIPDHAHRLRVEARMALYRFYAFVGRQKLGWGLRAKAKRALLSVFRAR